MVDECSAEYIQVTIVYTECHFSMTNFQFLLEIKCMYSINESKESVSILTWKRQVSSDHN